MTAKNLRDHAAKLSVETADQLTTRDVHELCDAAEEAILAGGGVWLAVATAKIGYGRLLAWCSNDPRAAFDYCKAG